MTLVVTSFFSHHEVNLTQAKHPVVRRATLLSKRDLSFFLRFPPQNLSSYFECRHAPRQLLAFLRLVPFWLYDQCV